MWNQTIRALASIAVALMASAAALGQEFPRRSLTLIVPAATGGPVDQVTRSYAASLGDILKVRIEIQNRPAAGGAEAIIQGRNAEPDGHTLVIVTSNGMLAMKVSEALRPKPPIPWQSLRELMPVAQLVTGPFVLVVNKDAPWTSPAAFLTAALGRPDGMDLGLSGTSHSGGPALAAMLMADLGIQYRPIPYRSEADLVRAVNEGNIQAAFVSATTVLADLQNGRLRGLAISSPERLPGLPQVPTFKELDFPHVEFVAWTGLFAPPGVSDPIMTILNNAVALAAQNSVFAAAAEKLGFAIAYRDGPQLKTIRDREFIRISRDDFQAHIGDGGGPGTRFSCEATWNVYSKQKCDLGCTQLCNAWGKGLQGCTPKRVLACAK
jgi:tripartite-type tricarboxylate transporter receptor subunit TctC